MYMYMYVYLYTIPNSSYTIECYINYSSLSLSLSLSLLHSPQLMLPAVPVFISATGLYDVEYHVSVACRDAFVYTLQTGGHTPKYKIPLGSQPCGLQRMDSNIYIGCMDNTLACYSTRVRYYIKYHETTHQFTQNTCFICVYICKLNLTLRMSLHKSCIYHRNARMCVCVSSVINFCTSFYPG